MTNHCSSRWKKYFTQVKADSFRDFSSFQQHPMLPSAYLKELTPQSSAGSFSGSLTTAEIPSLFSKGFHSKNTLEVQPSFRNSLLNTVYPCKPQSAIYFILPSALPGFRAKFIELGEQSEDHTDFGNKSHRYKNLQQIFRDRYKK